MRPAPGSRAWRASRLVASGWGPVVGEPTSARDASGALGPRRTRRSDTSGTSTSDAAVAPWRFDFDGACRSGGRAGRRGRRPRGACGRRPDRRRSWSCPRRAEFARSSRRAVATRRSERLAVERVDRRERVDALDEEDLVLVDVADAGHRALIEESLGDRPRRVAEARSRRSASAVVRSRRPRGPGRGAESAGCMGSTRVSNSSSVGRIEADGDRARDLEHETRPGRRPAPALAAARSGASCRACRGGCAAPGPSRSGCSSACPASRPP